MAATIEQVKAFVEIPVDGNTAVMRDEDIRTIIGVESNPFRAAAAVARKLASIYAQRIDIAAGSVRVQNSAIFRNYADLADKLELRALRDSASITPPIVAGGQDGTFHSELFNPQTR